MDRKKILKLRAEIERLRRQGGVKSAELESLAGRLGRKRAKRGKEPVWNSELPAVRPVAIPNHSRGVNTYTAGSILDQFEAELDLYEQLLVPAERTN